MVRQVWAAVAQAGSAGQQPGAAAGQDGGVVSPAGEGWNKDGQRRKEADG
jgi:hypothetical protein